MKPFDPIALADTVRSQNESFTDQHGRKWFIVERDLAVADDNLEAWCEQYETPAPATETAARAAGVAPPLSKAIAGTWDGKPMRWAPGTTLSWHIDLSTFPSQSNWAPRIEGYIRQAAAEWNAVAEQNNLNVRFTRAADLQAAAFTVRFQPFGGGTYAVAFFPHQPPNERVVRVGPLMFDPNSPFDPIGVMRHELGHVLGMRHEHISPDSPDQIESWLVGGVGAEALTPYDHQSVMHYPLSPGHGTNTFELTDYDKQGLTELYRMPANEVAEFAP